ncbi:MAG: recombination mediator RecR [Erysipelotrichaceae bacterium]|nr:recombination mediator RecR [Erysipelotrichaceae bacterium]MDY5252558.1 recombination mediator RecR [Erysipelotrichaceae bacterium]
MYPKSLENLIESFKMLPGVGTKSAQRYAMLMLEKSDEEIQMFAQALIDAKSNIKPCKICGNYTEDDICDICKDDSRNKDVICVVQSFKDVIAMEKTNEYHGQYHVLNGLISSVKGIMPQDLNIDSLLERIDGVKEVIIATSPTLEGETTAMYLSNVLKDKDVLVTRIAHGLQMGSHVDYVDELSLIKAMENRKQM